MQVSRKLRRGDWVGGYTLSWWCPGCKEMHSVSVREPGISSSPGWEFDGDLERPTFKPSVLIRSGHFTPTHKPGDDCWCTYNAAHPKRPGPVCKLCHVHVKAGQIQFLPDCSHALAGQTVEMPDLPPEHQDAPPQAQAG